MAIKDLELPGQGRMENLESWHGDLERSVRGSPDVGISGFCRPSLGPPVPDPMLFDAHPCLGIQNS